MFEKLVLIKYINIKQNINLAILEKGFIIFNHFYLQL